MAADPDALNRRAALAAYATETAACMRCPLASGRTQVVFGVGDPAADLMFVGEAPGFHEDKQGYPFVGQAGKLLDKLLGGIGLTRDDVYIANVIKCRPPGNRNPQPEEVAQCEPFLRRQVELLQPKIILAMGRFAVQMGSSEAAKRVGGLEGHLRSALVGFGFLPPEVDVDGASGTPTAESLEETPAGPSPAAVVHTARSKTTSKATASPAKPKAKTAAKPVAVPSADDLAIPDYDSLAASQVVSRLAGLRPTELTAVQRYELHHRGRKTILGRIAQLQAS